MPNLIILTNNHIVADMYPNMSRICSGSVYDVFAAVRDAVHMGAKIVSHPLSSSIKPNESPYKSVVISADTGLLDYKSLEIIEGAISVLKRLGGKNRDYSESVLEDFRIIDLESVVSACGTMVV